MISLTQAKAQFTEGLWHSNQALVALLGLCPLLAVSNSAVNAMALGLATLFVITASNFLVSLFRPLISKEVRIPAFVALIASLVTIIELILNAWWYEIYLSLGVFVPLIVTNCAILGRAEAFASKNRILPSILDGFSMGSGFFIVLTILGCLRELIATGGIFADMHLLFGSGVDWHVGLQNQNLLLLASFPPGAFILLGLMIALFNFIKR